MFLSSLFFLLFRFAELVMFFLLLLLHYLFEVFLFPNPGLFSLFLAFLQRFLPLLYLRVNLFLFSQLCFLLSHFLCLQFLEQLLLLFVVLLLISEHIWVDLIELSLYFLSVCQLKAKQKLLCQIRWLLGYLKISDANELTDLFFCLKQVNESLF